MWCFVCVVLYLYFCVCTVVCVEVSDRVLVEVVIGGSGDVFGMCVVLCVCWGAIL